MPTLIFGFGAFADQPHGPEQFYQLFKKVVFTTDLHKGDIQFVKDLVEFAKFFNAQTVSKYL